MSKELLINVLPKLSTYISGQECPYIDSDNGVEFFTHTLNKVIHRIHVMACRKRPIDGIIFSAINVSPIRIESLYVGGSKESNTGEQN